MPNTPYTVSVRQTSVGNTGQRSVSSSSSPASASVRNTVVARSVGQPGRPGQSGNVAGSQILPGSQPGLNPTGNPAMPALGQVPTGGTPNFPLPGGPDIPRPNPPGFTQGQDPNQYGQQLRDYVTDYRSRLMSALQNYRQGVRGAVSQSQANTPFQMGRAAIQGARGQLQGLQQQYPGNRAIAGGLESLSDAERWIIERESSGDPFAYNPVPTDSGNAFGLGQLTTLNRQRYAAEFGFDPDTTNPNEQLQMMRAYIRDRYGSPEAAMAFWQRNGWY